MKNLRRCFISIELPKEIVEYIVGIQKKLKQEIIFSGKLTEQENLHLTLKFLGEISDEEIEKTKEALREIDFKKFNVEFGKLGVFSKGTAKIVWLDLESDELFNLQKQIDEQLKNLFPPERRFMCHITIARVKKVFSRKKILSFLWDHKLEKMNFVVGEFSLKESKLSPGGPEYFDVERFSLN